MLFLNRSSGVAAAAAAVVVVVGRWEQQCTYWDGAILDLVSWRQTGIAAGAPRMSERRAEDPLHSLHWGMARRSTLRKVADNSIAAVAVVDDSDASCLEVHAKDKRWTVAVVGTWLALAGLPTTVVVHRILPFSSCGWV